MKTKLAGHPLAPYLWAATYVMLGLRYSSAFASMVLQGLLTKKESTTYQAIIAEGKAEAVIEGALSASRKMLLRMATHRFGPPKKANFAARSSHHRRRLMQPITDAKQVAELQVGFADGEEALAPRTHQ